MGELVDFNTFKKNRGEENLSDDPRLVVAVYQSVVYYVHMYMDEHYEDPVEHLTTNVSLRVLYRNDHNRFRMSFTALIRHWEITGNFQKEFSYQEAFVRFPTLGHLCAFIEKRVKVL